MEQDHKHKRLHVGMRNIKTCLAVFSCLLFYRLVDRDNALLAATAAIICMQGSVDKSLTSGLNRLFGTFVGAVMGLLFYLVERQLPFELTYLVFAPFGLMILIVLFNLLKRPDSIVIGCIMFLIIVMQEVSDSPLYYSFNRLLDTFFGILLAVLINSLIRNPSHEHGLRDHIKRINTKGVQTMYAEMMDTIGFVQRRDPQVGAAMLGELSRQRRNLELIASENLVSPAVMAAAGSVLTNKYAEGLPAKRYYGGCEEVDVVENIAIERAKKLFGANFANVQPHSGAQANEAAYFALVNPGDTILGMDLSQGGHLTHGSPVNFSGKLYNFVAYGVDPVTHRIDYDKLRAQALEVKPQLIVAGASAYPRAIDFARFAEIAKECGALFMVDMAHIAGLVAAGEHMNPLPYADIVTTTTHKTLRGIRGGLILCNDEETAKKVNKSVFPGLQGGPLMHIIAAKAVGLGEAMGEEFKLSQRQTVKNAAALAEALMKRGLKLVSGGTDNHLMLLDLSEMEITGKDLEKRLDEVYITVNKNTIPNETRSPFVTSGVRIGTPAVTTRGLKEAEMDVIAECIYKTATSFESSAEEVRQTVTELLARFPLYE